MTNTLTAISLRCVPIVGSDLDAFQPWTAGKKVFDRHALVLSQCLGDVLGLLVVKKVFRDTFVG